MDSSSFLIVGAGGQLGRALALQYPKARAVDMQELDIANIKAVESFDWNGITTILNVAAYTNVDGAETKEGRVSAWQANALAVSNLVKTALKKNLVLVHISTDYVFDGTSKLHKEDESFSPISVYGSSKAAGDIIVGVLPKHYILRTSWVIGDGKNFVRTMLELGKKSIAPTVVFDQIGRLTFTDELVRAIEHLLSTKAKYGTYNISNSGESVSWSDITRAIFKEAGFDLKVSDTTTHAYFAGKTGIAPRPLFSTLDLSKVQASGFTPVPWTEGLSNYIKKELAA